MNKNKFIFNKNYKHNKEKFFKVKLLYTSDLNYKYYEIKEGEICFNNNSFSFVLNSLKMLRIENIIKKEITSSYINFKSKNFQYTFEINKEHINDIIR